MVRHAPAVLALSRQLRDYRKLQYTMKGLDQVDGHLDPMWAHRINLTSIMGPKSDEMDLGHGPHAQDSAIIVNGTLRTGIAKIGKDAWWLLCRTCC